MLYGTLIYMESSCYNNTEFREKQIEPSRYCWM